MTPNLNHLMRSRNLLRIITENQRFTSLARFFSMIVDGGEDPGVVGEKDGSGLELPLPEKPPRDRANNPIRFRFPVKIRKHLETRILKNSFAENQFYCNVIKKVKLRNLININILLLKVS